IISSLSRLAFTAGNSCNAAQTAFVKNDMKPKPTPYFSLNLSLYLARKSMMGFISASLNVVSIAVSFFTATSRFAIVFRNEDNFSRLSSRVPVASMTGGAEATAGGGAFGSGTGTFRASSVVILPPIPLPWTWSAETPFSLKILAAAGEGCPCAYARFFSCAALISILQINPPTGRVVFSCAAMRKIPAALAGSSNVALSDSTSANTSSNNTNTPSFFSHFETVTSFMDSPTAGTYISFTSDTEVEFATTFEAAGFGASGSDDFDPLFSSISHISSPMTAVFPACFLMRRMPACGAASSNVALSDSNSAIISSNFTASPSFFFQDAIVTSEMDSPTAGTFTD